MAQQRAEPSTANAASEATVTATNVIQAIKPAASDIELDAQSRLTLRPNAPHDYAGGTEA